MLECGDFFLKLTKDLSIMELENEMNKQMLVMTLKPKDKFGIIDYMKLADLVGYEMPKGSNKEQIRKTFYRMLLKDLGGQDNIRELQARILKEDFQNKKCIQKSYFKNIIQGMSPSL